MWWREGVEGIQEDIQNLHLHAEWNVFEWKDIKRNQIKGMEKSSVYTNLSFRIVKIIIFIYPRKLCISCIFDKNLLTLGSISVSLRIFLDPLVFLSFVSRCTNFQPP